MKAVAYTHCHPANHPDAFDDVVLEDLPEPKGHELLVEIRAVSVNPVDTRLRAKADPAGEKRVLGYDAAGIVRARGPEAAFFHVGDEVFYAGVVNRQGSNAQFQLVDERIVGHKPKTLSFAEAASLPLTAITAWEALFDRLRIPRGGTPSGDAVLITGGAGGVGSIAVQLARRLTGLKVITTASRPETRAWSEQNGAHHVLDHSRDLGPQIKALGLPLPYIFSVRDTETHWNALADALAPQGGICVIDEMHGVDVQRIRPKAGFLAFEAMFARPLNRTADMVAQHHLLEEVAHMVDAGALRHTMTKNLGPLTATSLAEAHQLVESSSMIGKVVLEGIPA
ncbi:MAG TPA: zinc-binding alcohol dehydrogenase family protein [Roseomonas sp.]|jgi:NADPH2:quinone reductase